MTRKLAFPTLSLAAWSSADQAAWRAANAPGDVLDEGGPLADRHPEQLSQMQMAYGRWLGFLAATGDAGAGLDRLQGLRLRQFIDALKASLAPLTVRSYVTNLLTAAEAMAPGRAFADLRNATRSLWRWAKPADKRARLIPADELSAFGLDLMVEADRQKLGRRPASLHQDGLMIALLAARPLRRRNLASIELGRHLERQGEDYWLSFPAQEMKNRRALEFTLPRNLVAPLESHLGVYRPLLLKERGRWRREGGGALWISAHGGPLGAKQVHERIVARTQARFGHPVNPHMFRDAAATSIAIEDPAHVGLVASILGHANPQTAERFYNQAGSLEAGRCLQAVIQSFRSRPGDHAMDVRRQRTRGGGPDPVTDAGHMPDSPLPDRALGIAAGK